MRPLLFITVGYIIGIIWGLYLNTSIVPIFFLLIIIILILSKIGAINLKKYKSIFIMLFIPMVISNVQILYLENKYENLYNEGDISVVGTVISSKEETTYKNKYVIKVESVNSDTKYKKTNLIIYVDKDVELKYGDMISFSGEFNFASKQTNYKAFDYREYLKTKNIYGIISVDSDVNVLKENNMGLCFMIANSISEKIKTNLEEILGENSSIAIGILIGDTSEISDTVIENFKTSSMYHILAVSGTHIRICHYGDNYPIIQNKCLKKENKSNYGHIFDSVSCF